MKPCPIFLALILTAAAAWADGDTINYATTSEIEQAKKTAQLAQKTAQLAAEKSESENLSKQIKETEEKIEALKAREISGFKTVRLGMTKQECLELVGNPREINRTKNAFGSLAQWVYHDGRYLYFDNSVLTSIQD
jgi:uncharacterized protein YdcH (DUF465 family)